LLKIEVRTWKPTNVSDTTHRFLHGIGARLRRKNRKKKTHRLKKKHTHTKKKKKKMENGNLIEKLNDENFHIWKHRMKALLVTKGLDGALEKGDDPHSAQALAQMCLCVGTAYVNLIASAESAYVAWTTLENINAGQTAARRLKLRRELTSLKKGATESMISYIMRGKQIGTSLRAIDETVSDAHLIDSILAGLPDEYTTKVDMLITLGETDMLKLLSMLVPGLDKTRPRLED